MSILSQIQENLQETGAAIAQLEKAIATSPKSASLAATHRSLEKRLRNLESDFAKFANRAGIDVCSYRIFTENGGNPPIGPLSSAFVSFQKLVSTVYSAVKSGQKQRATYSAEDAAASTFDFGYSFSGSVGFVLTICNERLLLGETALDESMAEIFRMAKATAPEDMHPFVERFGSGAVRALYRWAEDHGNAGLGADIDWRRGEKVLSEIFLPPVQFTELRRVLDEAGDEKVEEVSLTGDLTAVSLPSKSFQMKFDSGGDIRGKFEDAIGLNHTVELPKRYTAKLKKTSRIVYSLAEDEESYFLLCLEPA